MPEENDKPSGFKVVDRRGWASNGTRREAPEAEPPAPSSGPAEVSQPAPPEPAEKDEPESFEPSGFDTIISYLSTTALFQLGLLAGPGGERIPPDLANARRTIDMLEVLQQKTRGNLTADETQMLEEVLYELRMSYIEIQKRLTKSPQ